MDFSFYPLRFHLTALDPIRFPSGLAANILRGGFGLMLRRHTTPELYQRIFEPSARGAGPSGLKDWPRPFVFRARHLNGLHYQPGEAFHFDVNLFDTRPECVQAFGSAFEELGKAGLGPDRGRAQLSSFQAPELTTLELTPFGPAVEHIRVEILTPLELKASGEIAATPEFSVLFARIRDRLSTLRALYGPGPLDIDFKAMAERAGEVRIVNTLLTHSSAQRRSSRSGQTHNIGGLTGSVEYSGELRGFLPYLRAAESCGVGRHCVWGKGQIQVTVCK